MKSQEKRILKYLLKGHTLTPMQAEKKFHCMRLGARIWDLIHIRGYEIDSVPLKVGPRTWVSKYFMKREKK